MNEVAASIIYVYFKEALYQAEVDKLNGVSFYSYKKLGLIAR